MDNKNEKEYLLEVVAGDFNSPLFRNYIFVLGFPQYPKLLNLPAPIMSIVSKNNVIEYAGNGKAWFSAHEELKKQVMKDYHRVEEIIDLTNSFGEAFNEWSQREIKNADLTRLSNKPLADLLEKFIEKQAVMYAYGTSLPTLDFQKFSFVEGNLNEILKKKLSEEEYREAYRVFTEPSKNSFSQDQDEDLLVLMERYYDEAWFNSLKDITIQDLKVRYPEFYKDLQKHTDRHCWVYYVYAGPAFTQNNFLDFIKENIKKNINPSQKLEEIKKKKEDNRKLFEHYINKIKPNEFENFILHLAGKVVWAKPRRKDYQSKSYYHSEKLLIEIGKRVYLTLDQVRSCPPDMLKEALLKGTELDVNYISSLKKFHICLFNEGKTEVLEGKKAIDFYEENVKKHEELAVNENINQLQGSVACAGLAKGHVKIINTPQEMSKMNEGDVLVSIATTPSIVPVMKKACAIITDEGGLTCHAAIVSRELGTPCIVGLKIATRAFKDGDLVEVDANTGIVRKIKQ